MLYHMQFDAFCTGSMLAEMSFSGEAIASVRCIVCIVSRAVFEITGTNEINYANSVHKRRVILHFSYHKITNVAGKIVGTSCSFCLWIKSEVVFSVCINYSGIASST